MNEPMIPDKLFFKIGEVADIAGLEQHVLRYWEEEFSVLAPNKNKSGQRLYQRKDIDLVLEIKRLLYTEMYTIAGAKKNLKEKGKKNTQMDFGFNRERFSSWQTEVRKELESMLKILK